MSPSRARGKDGSVQCASLSRSLQCCSLSSDTGKGFSLPRAGFTPAPARPRTAHSVPTGEGWPGCPALTWLHPLQHSTGWNLCCQGRATRTFAASLLSCVLGCTLPLKPDPVLQKSCILLSFISVSSLFHLPGSTLALHLAAFCYFLLMPIF